LTSQLRALKLSTMAESFSDIALKVVRSGLSHKAYLLRMPRARTRERKE
jgi:hypothetical protein